MALESTERASLIGGVLAAIVASACCLGPFVLVSVGISGAWISNLAALEPFRPYALAVAVVCVAFAYQRIYRTTSAEACAPGTLCAMPQARRAQKIMFWILSALVLVSFGFPYAARFLY